MLRKLRDLGVAALTTFAIPGGALAVDGVLEINQTCATLSGCFAGDTAGFPVTISTVGSSVRLTSSLTIPDSNTTAIEVTATNASIDLNGYAIVGPNDNLGAPVSTCPVTGAPTPFGTGIGIDASGVQGTRVFGGTVRGMGNHGISLGAVSRVEDMVVTDNGGNGILASVAAMVVRNIVASSCANGISIDSGSIAVHNGVRANNILGLESINSVLIGNNATANRGGFSAGASGMWHSRSVNDPFPNSTGITEDPPNFCGTVGGTECDNVN